MCALHLSALYWQDALARVNFFRVLQTMSPHSRCSKAGVSLRSLLAAYGDYHRTGAHVTFPMCGLTEDGGEGKEKQGALLGFLKKKKQLWQLRTSPHDLI